MASENVLKKHYTEAVYLSPHRRHGN